MGKTEEDWNGLKLGFLKTVQPNSFSKLTPAACNFKNNAQETFVCLGSLILSFTCNFFAYFKFHSDWGRVIGKIKQNELDAVTQPLQAIQLHYPVDSANHLLNKWGLIGKSNLVMNSNRNVWIFCITHDATESVNSSIFSLVHKLFAVH